MGYEEDSSKMSSDQIKQQIAEQAAGLEEEADLEATEQPEGADAEPTEESEEAAEEQETTGEEEVEQPEPKPHEPSQKSKEEDIPFETIIDYAQKTKPYDEAMRRLKEEREALLRQSQGQPGAQPQGSPDLTPEKLNERFLQMLAKDPIGTLAQFNSFILQQREAQLAEERKAERKFDIDQTESNPVWPKIKPRYNEYRDLGYTREMALLLAENDFLKQAIVSAKTVGMRTGEAKAKAKKKAEIPTGHRATAKAPRLGNLDETQLSRMTSKALKAILPNVKTPGF